MNKIKSLTLLSLLVLTCISSLNASDKIYVEDKFFKTSQDIYYIHEGNNVWIESNSIHRDISGYYIHQHAITTNKQGQHEKKWKCPYCYKYWPLGTACKNPSCPSRYK